MQKLTRIMLLSEPGKGLEYKLETQEIRGIDRSMLGTPMQHGEKWLQPPKCHAWLTMLTALSTYVSHWTDGSPASGTLDAANTTCSTGRPVAIESTSKSRSTKLRTQSWQSDGGSKTTTITSLYPSPYNIPLHKNSWRRWKQHTFSSCSPSSISHTLHPICADHCVSYTGRGTAKQQDSGAFGQKSEGRGCHHGCKTSTTATPSHHRLALGRSCATSAPTQNGDSRAFGPCCKAKPAPRAYMDYAVWQATCPMSTSKPHKKL